MTHLIKFPSIEQFRTIVKHVRDSANFHSIPTPSVTFTGKVKLHGTNAGVADNGKERWAQSHHNIITLEKDNFGFAQYVHAHSGIFDILFSVARFMKNDHPIIKSENHTVAIYGEWCGKGIQKGVAVGEVPKMFVVFDVRISTKNEDGEDGESYWFTEDELVNLFAGIDDEVPFRVANTQKIYYIGQFPTWSKTIDFANPEQSQNDLIDLTLAVETECPAGKFFGVSGIGEGIVWSADYPVPGKKMRFKVKGEKHSVSKVKTLVEVDTVKLASIEEFVERVVTVNRLEQMKQRVVDMGLDPLDVKNVGAFLKHLGSDVIKEESDVLEALGISNKEVMSRVNRAGRDWLMTQMEVR